MWEQNTSQQVDVFLHPQILNNKIHLAFLLITGRWGSLLCALPDRTRTQYVAWKDLYPNNIANLLQTFLKTISSSSGIFWGSWTSVNLFCLRVLEVNKKNRERQHLLSCVLAFQSHWTSSILLLMHTLRYTHDITSPCGSLINCLIYTFKIQQNTFTHRLQSGLLETKPETRTFTWSVEPQISGERGWGGAGLIEQNTVRIQPPVVGRKWFSLDQICPSTVSTTLHNSWNRYSDSREGAAPHGCTCLCLPGASEHMLSNGWKPGFYITSKHLCTHYDLVTQN